MPPAASREPGTSSGPGASPSPTGRLSTLRRGTGTLALRTFRRLPAPVRRTLVRAGTPGYTVGAVVAIEHDGAVLFLSQPHREGWSLPGGLLDRGERPDEAVEREVAEETGLRVRVGLPVGTQVNPRVCRVDVVYRLVCERRPRVTVGGEARGHRWMAVDDVPVADAPTREILAVLARAAAPSPYDGRLLPG